MPEHRERLRWPGWLRLALTLMGLILVASLVGLIREAGAKVGPPARIAHLLAIGMLILLGGLCWYFRYLEVRFSPDGIGYGFGRIRRLIPRECILSLEVCAYDWLRYMGWGWRIGPARGERAYSVLGHPRGLRVVFRRADASEASLFLSCADPEAAMRALDRPTV